MADVVVPEDLAGPLARLIDRGLREAIRSSGGAGLQPRLVALLTELAAADLRSLDRDQAATSASGSDGAVSATLVSVSTAAERLECSTRWARHLAASGRLRARQIGREWLIEEQSLEELRRGTGAA